MSVITLDELGHKLSRAFPTANIVLPIRALGKGYASEVVETSDGVVFKIARNHIAQDSYNKERRLLLFLSGRIHGVQIPVPEYYIASCSEFPFGLLGYHKVEGDILNAADIGTDRLKKVAARIADFLYQLHRVDISLPEVAGLNLEPFPPSLAVVKQTWLNVSDWLQANLTDEHFFEITNFWKAAERFWESNDQSPVLTHGDLWPENIILDQAQNVAGIIDFGSARVGDPAIDFAVQRYVSSVFRDEVIEHYIRLGGDVGANLDQRMAYLLALREFYGLEYGMMTNHVESDTLKKIKEAVLKR